MLGLHSMEFPTFMAAAALQVFTSLDQSFWYMEITVVA
jgi:hypothetical protein